MKFQHTTFPLGRVNVNHILNIAKTNKIILLNVSIVQEEDEEVNNKQQSECRPKHYSL
jgi:hypothetical protein